MDGDGRHDIVVYTAHQSGNNPGTGTTGLLLSTSTATAASFVIHNLANTVGTPIFLNANNDRCTDVAYGTTVWLMTCNGSVGSTVTAGGSIAIDWDADGRDDLISLAGSTLTVAESTGAGFAAPTSTMFPSTSVNYFVFDPSGNGLRGLGYVNSIGLYVYEHNGASAPPDLVSTIADGFGNSFSPTFVPISNISVVTSKGIYPQASTAVPIYVVKQYSASDGAGAMYTHSFKYFDARNDLTGRGFLGFSRIQKLDSRTGLYTQTYYHQDFPYIGQILEQDLLEADNATFVSYAQNIWQETDLSGTNCSQRCFPHVHQSTSSTYEVQIGGSLYGQKTATSITTNTFDTSGNLTNTTTTATDNDPGSPYSGQSWSETTATTVAPDLTVNWCLNVPTQVQVTRQSPGTTAVTRTVSFAPDYAKCRETKRITEPGSVYQVTETYGFDSFGNLSSDTVVGANVNVSPATRVTGQNWGVTGQFLMSVTDPLNEQTQFDYDFRFGTQSKVIDPNSSTATPIVTTRAYDDLGRLSQETRPDGTYTIFTYNDCSSTGGCVVGTHGYAVAHSIRNKDGSVWSDGTILNDLFDRPLVATDRLLANGTYDRREQRYNSIGLVAKQAAPCIWTSNTAACGFWTTYGYDVSNRLTQTQRPISSTNSSLQTTTISYSGRTVTTTDPQAKKTAQVITVAQTLGKSVDALGYSVSMNYDGFGSLLSVTDSAANSLKGATYKYGIGAFPVSTTDIDLGSRTVTFDAFGEIASYTDAKSQHFSFTYDGLSRPLSRSEPDLSTTWVWGNSAANHNLGQLSSMSTNTSSETYSYDALARLTAHTLSSDSSYTYTLGYDANTGTVGSLTYPTNTSGYALSLKYSYQNGVLNRVTDSTGAPTYWTNGGTNARGQITSETLGNGVVINRVFDSVTSWLGSIQAGVGGGTALQNNGYLYDDLGTVTQRQDNTRGLTESFFYDDDYRLTRSTLGGVQNLSVGYDALGNITTRSDVGSGATWTYDPVRRHAVKTAGPNSYSYDANGNVSLRSGSTVSVTSYNMPSQIVAGSETAQLSYDGNHQRYLQVYNSTAGTETTYYIGGLLGKL